jgi:Uma2 family endonuclease
VTPRFDQDIDLDAPRAPRMPDLAVEVRSPATWVYDVGPKRDLYERHGLRELWLADTASRTLLIYRRSQEQSGFDFKAELTAEHDRARSRIQTPSSRCSRREPSSAPVIWKKPWIIPR